MLCLMCPVLCLLPSPSQLTGCQPASQVHSIAARTCTMTGMQPYATASMMRIPKPAGRVHTHCFQLAPLCNRWHEARLQHGLLHRMWMQHQFPTVPHSQCMATSSDDAHHALRGRSRRWRPASPPGWAAAAAAAALSAACRPPGSPGCHCGAPPAPAVTSTAWLARQVWAEGLSQPANSTQALGSSSESQRFAPYSRQVNGPTVRMKFTAPEMASYCTCSQEEQGGRHFDDVWLMGTCLPCAGAVLGIGRHQGAVHTPHLGDAAQEVQQRGPAAEREVAWLRPGCRRVLRMSYAVVCYQLYSVKGGKPALQCTRWRLPACSLLRGFDSRLQPLYSQCALCILLL